LPRKIVCQQSAARPYWKPRAKGIASLWTPHFSSHCGGQTTKMQFATDAKKNKRKHLRCDCESANLPFDADNLNLYKRKSQIVSICCGREKYENSLGGF
jgi:hypothetical protein